MRGFRHAHTLHSRPADRRQVSDLPEAVLFDMDGLLVDSEKTWYLVELEVMARLGGDFGPENQVEMLGGTMLSGAQYMLELSGRTDVSVEEIAEQMLDGMVTHLRRGPVDWMPGAQRLLAAVEEAGVPRALVSSSHRAIVDAVLDAVGREHFDVTVSGDDVTETKPAPEPYLLAATLLGVDPRRCVAVEDSPPGAASAHAAGCVTIAVPSIKPVPDDVTDLQAGSLEDVDLDVLARLMHTARPA
jgi:HAD superfamily hydrolase (TIGR01509 family)